MLTGSTGRAAASAEGGTGVDTSDVAVLGDTTETAEVPGEDGGDIADSDLDIGELKHFLQIGRIASIRSNNIFSGQLQWWSDFSRCWWRI